jgi:hypothetical protein
MNEPLLLVAWSGLCVLGTGMLVFFVMQSRMEVLLSAQREALATARATLAAQKEAMEASLKNVEETTRRVAMDGFLADIRVEERHYTREHKVLFMNRKVLVRQERIFFRNIPLSNWIEHEMSVEEGADMEKMAQSMSIFANALLEDYTAPRTKLLR